MNKVIESNDKPKVTVAVFPMCECRENQRVS